MTVVIVAATYFVSLITNCLGIILEINVSYFFYRKYTMIQFMVFIALPQLMDQQILLDLPHKNTVSINSKKWNLRKLKLFALKAKIHVS